MRFDGIDLVEEVLRNDRDSIRVPERLDTLVMKNVPIRPGRYVPVVLKLAFAFLLAAVLLTGYSFNYSRGLDRECRRVYAAMVEAAENRDIDKAVSFFDLAAMGIDETRFRSNMAKFFDGFGSVRYVVKDIKVRTSGRDVLAQTKYEFKAAGSAGRFDVRGSDRVYFHKRSDGLKITCWIAEE